MKKILIVLFLNLSFCAFGDDNIPLLFDNLNPAIGAQAVDSTEIDFGAMKKRDKIEAMKDNMSQKENPTKIKLNVKEIKHQRALDYSTKQNNTLPVLF